MQRQARLVAALVLVAAWPPLSWAQSSKPQVGFLNNGSPSAFAPLVEAFRTALQAGGYVEGQNVSIEYRWAEGRNGRLPALIDDLVRKRVSVIAATGGGPTPLAVHRAAVTIPVVFVIGSDPVKLGLVSSLNRPGGNMTGVSFLANSLLPKQIEVLHEAVGGGGPLGFLVNPANPNSETDTVAVTAAAARVGRNLLIQKAESAAEAERALSILVEQKIAGLLIYPDSVFTSMRLRLVALTSQYRLAAIYNSRQFAEEGGLIGYGTNQIAAYRYAGEYTARILKGEKASDLPVAQSDAVELTVNLKTAKSLGIEIPQTLLARADRIIE